MQTVATVPTTNNASYTDDSRYTKLSVLTCVVLVWFHIHAVAALWSFTWTNLFAAAFL
jgi:hypothetical protein